MLGWVATSTQRIWRFTASLLAYCVYVLGWQEGRVVKKMLMVGAVGFVSAVCQVPVCLAAFVRCALDTIANNMSKYRYLAWSRMLLLSRRIPYLERLPNVTRHPSWETWWARLWLIGKILRISQMDTARRDFLSLR